MADDHKCHRCGGALKVMTVQVPVYLEHQTFERMAQGMAPERVLARYEEREDVADCARCLGAY